MVITFRRGRHSGCWEKEDEYSSLRFTSEDGMPCMSIRESYIAFAAPGAAVLE